MTDQYKDTGSVKHVREEGSRRHVVYYEQGQGAVCSEENCEMNRLHIERKADMGRVE